MRLFRISMRLRLISWTLGGSLSMRQFELRGFLTDEVGVGGVEVLRDAGKPNEQADVGLQQAVELDSICSANICEVEERRL